MTMSAAEEEAREKLAQCGRAFERLGLYGLGGHVSLRSPDSDLILVTPGGGLDKRRLSPSDLVTIDAQGKRVAGPFPPPREWPIHTEIHAARPELDSVAHLHAHWPTVFSVTRIPLQIVMLPASCLGPQPIGTYDEPLLVSTVEQGKALDAALGDAAAVLMRWHGITVVGQTLEQMFMRAVSLEENARLLWEARAMGGEILTYDVGAAEPDSANLTTAVRTFNYYVNLERGEDEQIFTSNLGPRIQE